MNERDYGKGARKINPIRRKIHKAFRKKLGRAGIPFDWEKGYDVRDIIGPIKIKNQGSSSSCGGQAGAYFLEVQRRLQKVIEGAISAKSIYDPIAYSGGGTTITALMSQVGSMGANLETTVPSYYVTGEPLPESLMTESSWHTPQLAQDALKRAGYTPYDISEDIESVAQAIRDFGGVIIEIRGQNNGSWITKNPVPPVKGKGDYWYHFLYFCGAKMIDGKQTLIALNSWGEKIGAGGAQYFTKDYISNGFVDAFTFVYGKNISPVDGNKTIWAEIIRWFKRQPWFGKSRT